MIPLAAAYFDGEPTGGDGSWVSTQLAAFREMDEEEAQHGGSGELWSETLACPNLFDGPVESSRKRKRYGSLLDFLGRLAQRYGAGEGLLPEALGREAFLQPPGASASGAVTYGDEETAKMCITLCPDRLCRTRSARGHDGKRIIFSEEGSGYYVVRVGKRKKKTRQVAVEIALKEGGAVKVKSKRNQWRYERAHRIVLWCAFGPAPQGYGLAVHMCGNPRCLNPEHLLWGDDATNRIRPPMPKEAAMTAYHALLVKQKRRAPTAGAERHQPPPPIPPPSDPSPPPPSPP
jgi:hypothetical protein